MGLLPLDLSRVGQMRRVGCCLVYGSCCESRAFLCELRGIPAIHKDTLWCVAAFTAAGARPGLFASQRRGRAGQRSEQRQRAAYFFAL
jgi:hypothetical protein